jgi:formate-dependent nitrite reductase membrane component NrfD
MTGQPESDGQRRSDGQPRSYYGRPIVKTPPWTDEIPWYLFTGGLAGGSAALALGARAVGNDRLATNAMAASAAAVTVSLPLLVHDLGRPGRFHHMLRMFKPTSPMNVGSWILAGIGPAAVGAAVANRLGIFPRLARTAEVAAGLLGPALATYTGVLIADTAVPTWHSAGNELPMLFASSAAASAGGLASMVTPHEDAGPARRLAVGGLAVELGTAILMRRRLGPLAAPYRQGQARSFGALSGASGIAGALLLGLGGRRRALAAAGGALLVASSAFQRFSVYRAGIESARDPGYAVAQQRARIASAGQQPAIRR